MQDDQSIEKIISRNNSSKALTIIFLLFITILSIIVPKTISHFIWPIVGNYLGGMGSDNFHYVIFLLFSFALISKRPKQYGLCLGNIKQHCLKVIFVCGLPIILTAIVYPFTTKPFTGLPVGIWLISPIAQDILFMGFIYTSLEKVYPGSLTFIKSVSVNKCLLIGAFIYAGWHASNFINTPIQFVFFQVVFTFIAYISTGLSRQWTGSFIYVTLFHMSSNFIAVKI